VTAPASAVVFGATSAIAQAAVRRLAAAGGALVLVGRDPVRLEAVAADARVRGARVAEPLVADLDDDARHEALLAAAAERLGRIDLVLVAHGLLATTEDCARDPSLVARLLRTNLVGTVLLVERAAARLAAQGAGTVAVVGSVAGDRGRPSNYVYGATKGGLAVYLDGLRHALRPRGVNVLDLRPGPVDSPMTAHLPRNRPYASPAAVADALLRGVERGRGVVYAPAWWRPVMLVVRLIPDRIFGRLRW
jgi:short-subunit dehydrogenase